MIFLKANAKQFVFVGKDNDENCNGRLREERKGSLAPWRSGSCRISSFLHNSRETFHKPLAPCPSMSSASTLLHYLFIFPVEVCCFEVFKYLWNTCAVEHIPGAVCRVCLLCWGNLCLSEHLECGTSEQRGIYSGLGAHRKHSDNWHVWRLCQLGKAVEKLFIILHVWSDWWGGMRPVQAAVLWRVKVCVFCYRE